MNVVDVSERLMAEFEGRLGPDLVAKAVMACRHDLAAADTPSDGALPELVERCARARLLVALGERSAGDDLAVTGDELTSDETR